MKKSKFFKMVLWMCLLLMTSIFNACGASKEKEAPKAEVKAEEVKPIKVGIIFASTIDDMAWSQSMYQGAKAVQDKLGKDKMDLQFSERLGSPVDAGAAIRQYALQKFDIIIAHGAQYQSVIEEIAAEFPETTFAYGGSEAKLPNIFAYDPNAQEGSYLLGMLAGLNTKTNVIGIVGPVDAGEATKYNSGFIQGVKAVNPKADVKIAFTGSFGDIVAAGEVASTHIKAGADILTGSSQQSVGAIKVASQNKGVLWFGTNVDQSVLAPDSVVGCELYLFENLVTELIEKRASGKLGGESLQLTFANGQLDLILNDKLKSQLTPESLEKMESTKEELKKGTKKIEVVKY